MQSKSNVAEAENVFFLLAFNSTSFAIQAEKQIKKDFKIAVMPTPRELTASCGLAVRFYDGALGEIKKYVQDLNIPCVLYAMAETKKDGRRDTEKLLEILEK